MEEFDPTYTDIDHDPTVRRFRGVARHGWTPFDVPYISEITSNLWVGGCKNGLKLPKNIAAVFLCTLGNDTNCTTMLLPLKKL